MSDWKFRCTCGCLSGNHFFLGEIGDGTGAWNRGACSMRGCGCERYCPNLVPPMTPERLAIVQELIAEIEAERGD